MGQKSKNAGKKKTKIQEPKLATEGLGVLKLLPLSRNSQVRILNKKHNILANNNLLLQDCINGKDKEDRLSSRVNYCVNGKSVW